MSTKNCNQCKACKACKCGCSTSIHQNAEVLADRRAMDIQKSSYEYDNRSMHFKNKQDEMYSHLRGGAKGGSVEIYFDNLQRDLGLKKYSDYDARQICDRIKNNQPEWVKCFKKNYRGY